MDVDTLAMESTSSPQVDYSLTSEAEKTPKDRLLDLLDRVEIHVERLRKEAAKLEEDRDTLFTTLDTIRNSDHLANLEHIESSASGAPKVLLNPVLMSTKEKHPSR
ncbi:BAG molecular chaperone regulator 2 [Homalodisca vitripennis]|nr:BAG molecular chaperone regulator 2 [Homalodisca vitripennis]